MRRRALEVVVAILAMVIPLAATAVPAHADTAADQFLAKINDLRASKGLGALRVDGALTTFAQNWSDHMAATRTLSHNPALSSSPGTWTKAGENVGVGADVDGLFAAFVASPHHYENLTDPSFTIVGIGVTVLADGTMYTTHDFEARPAAATVSPHVTTTTTTAPRPPPVPTTAARPVAKPTTTTAPHRPTPSTTSTTSPPTPVTTPPVPVAVTVPPPPPPPPAPVVPARITLSLDQLRGFDPTL